MKTLDEVITELEDARVQVETGTGYWVDYRDNDDLKAYALHYLREYRKIDSLDAVAFQEDDNPPLTWDELKTMEGKPVWITYDGVKGGWVIVGKSFSLFENDEPDAYVYMYYLKNKIEGSKELYGSYWQAYRKERE